MYSLTIVFIFSLNKTVVTFFFFLYALMVSFLKFLLIRVLKINSECSVNTFFFNSLLTKIKKYRVIQNQCHCRSQLRQPIFFFAIITVPERTTE